jgi:16S rRNA (uracil1498-N3)-methyltransferase
LNLVLLQPDDFVNDICVRVAGARAEHIRTVHRAKVGDVLTVGLIGGRIGRGEVTGFIDDACLLNVWLEREPPPKVPVTLILALPRPKVLNRVIAAATSMGVQRIVLLNCWRVEKSYWKSPRMSDENLLHQRVLGLEQAKDTVLPELRLARLFVPFVERELPALAAGSTCLVAHPHVEAPAPRALAGAITLAVGPEGGFIPAELDSLARAGFAPVSLGARVLRVETAVAALLGRLLP